MRIAKGEKKEGGVQAFSASANKKKEKRKRHKAPPYHNDRFGNGVTHSGEKKGVTFFQGGKGRKRKTRSSMKKRSFHRDGERKKRRGIFLFPRKGQKHVGSEGTRISAERGGPVSGETKRQAHPFP